MKRLSGKPDRKSARRRIARELAERLAESENLAGLRSGNDPFKAGVLAAAVLTLFLTFNVALDLALFFIPLFLPAELFSTAFFHPITLCLRRL